MEKLNKYDEAEKEFKKAIEINSKVPDFYYNLGGLLEKIGRNDEARQQYDRAKRNK